VSAGKPRAAGLAAVDPPQLGAPRGYSHGILVPAGRRLLFVAGQVGWGPGQTLVAGGLVEQFAQALRNVLAVVRAAGGEPADVGRLTLYVLDREDYARQSAELGRRYRELMGRHYPAMALVEVRGLMEPGALIEIEATAAVP
jgi:enamine deaminase RidA (YjgF/YER057c/UK114 family)